MGDSWVFSIHLALIFVVFLFLNPANAQPTPTPIQLPQEYEWKMNPANGHYYAMVNQLLPWNEARINSEKLGVHLVTITSRLENDWIKYAFPFSCWIGYRLDTQKNKWVWVTGESSTYRDWLDSNFLIDTLDGNDWSAQLNIPFNAWSPLHGQTLYPSLIEYDTISTPRQLPTGYDWKYNPANGHYYCVVKQSLTFNNAYSFALSIGAYIATILDANENQWILNLLHNDQIDDAWIGTYTTKEFKNYIWVTTEPFSFSSWAGYEPQSGGCYYAYMNRNNLWYTMNGDTAIEGFVLEIGEPIFPPDPTPTVTPTPTITPTPTPIPENWLSLNGATLEKNDLWADAPGGYNKGKIQFGEIPAGNYSDGKGMEIKLAPGQGVWILSNKVFEMASLAEISGSFRASNRNVSIALVGLNSPIDGQIGYTNAIGDEVPVNAYRPFHIIYGPPSGKLQIALQTVNPSFSTMSSTVWVDNLFAEPYTPSCNGDPVSLQVNGNFNSGLQNLMVNINGDDGSIVPFFQSLADIAIRLSIDPANTAANIGTTCLGLSDKFPLRLVGQVGVQRDSLPGGGTIGFVITNGFQNLGLFRYADQIPDINSSRVEYLMLGGDFNVNNPNIPVSAIVQIGGPGADVSVVVDDLMIFK